MHAARGAAQRMTAVRRRGVLPRDHLCACAVPPRMYFVELVACARAAGSPQAPVARAQAC
jgi:hypothetical protein